jgi:16S rRNA (adenine1518-N6/adenine1519-N6)-dimethyltransferase
VTTELLGARRLREVLARHGVRPSRALGQNFVVDPNTIRKVMDVADVPDGAHVLEIGPGAGSLTLALAAHAARVTAVELDRFLVPVLGEVLRGVTNVEVINADALQLDLASLGATDVVANLPYNVAVPLVMRLLSDAPSVGRITVMTQKEVGERLAAAPGSKVYGVPSLMAAFDARVEVAAAVSRRAFWPVPKVDSVLVRLTRRQAPDVDRALVATVVRAAFSQRRKTLRRSLETLLGERAAETLAEAGVDPAARAEQISLEGFVQVAKAMSSGN